MRQKSRRSQEILDFDLRGFYNYKQFACAESQVLTEMSQNNKHENKRDRQYHYR